MIIIPSQRQRRKRDGPTGAETGQLPPRLACASRIGTSCPSLLPANLMMPEGRTLFGEASMLAQQEVA